MKRVRATRFAGHGRWPPRCRPTRQPAAATALHPRRPKVGHLGRKEPDGGPELLSPRGRRVAAISAINATVDPARTAANTPRQCPTSAIAPAASGPAIDGTSHAVVSSPNILARRDSGMARAMITYTRTETTPPPRPCSNRPTTKTGMPGATTHRAIPVRNSPPPQINGVVIPARSAQVPPATIPIRAAVMVAAYAKEYHPRPSRSAATTGRTVVTANDSNAMNVISASDPATTGHR